MSDFVSSMAGPVERVAVIVLSWNRRQSVLECVARLKRTASVRFHIVVIDNASTDGSADQIAHRHPDVTVLRQSTNGGFVGGVNRGLAEAVGRGDSHAWLVNDDTIIEESTLRRLLDGMAAQPGVGLASPLLLDSTEDGAEQFRRGIVDWQLCRLRYNLSETSVDRLDAAGISWIVPGTALLCDLRVYRAIGALDPRFFAYWEDIDYCVRSESAGFAAIVIDGVAVHHAAAARDARPPHFSYYMTRNEALFWGKHRSRRRLARSLRGWLSRSLLCAAESRDNGHHRNADAVVDGIWHAVLRRFGPRETHAPAPRWFRRLALAAPYAMSALLDGRYGEVANALRRKATAAIK